MPGCPEGVGCSGRTEQGRAEPWLGLCRVLGCCLQHGGTRGWKEKNKVQRENKRGCAVLRESPGSPQGEGAGAGCDPACAAPLPPPHPRLIPSSFASQPAGMGGPGMAAAASSTSRTICSFSFSSSSFSTSPTTHPPSRWLPTPPACSPLAPRGSWPSRGH